MKAFQNGHFLCRSLKLNTIRYKYDVFYVVSKILDNFDFRAKNHVFLTKYKAPPLRFMKFRSKYKAGGASYWGGGLFEFFHRKFFDNKFVANESQVGGLVHTTTADIPTPTYKSSFIMMGGGLGRRRGVIDTRLEPQFFLWSFIIILTLYHKRFLIFFGRPNRTTLHVWCLADFWGNHSFSKDNAHWGILSWVIISAALGFRKRASCRDFGGGGGYVCLPPPPLAPWAAVLARGHPAPRGAAGPKPVWFTYALQSSALILFSNPFVTIVKPIFYSLPTHLSNWSFILSSLLMICISHVWKYNFNSPVLGLFYSRSTYPFFCKFHAYCILFF